MGKVIRKRLETLRLHLRAASAVTRATRTLFYALLLVCAVLAMSRLLHWPVPEPVLMLVPAVTLILGLLSGWMRRLTLHDCAVLVDRQLGLDDRVATSLEAKGPFETALSGDTARVLDQKSFSPLSRIRWPRETFFLVLSLPLAAFLWFAPSLETAKMIDPGLLAVAQTERGRLMNLSEEAELAGVESELDMIEALLVEPTPETMQEAVEKLRALEVELEKRMEASGISPEQIESLRALSGSVAAAGAGVARALEKKGLLPPNWEPLSPLDRNRLSGEGIVGGRHASERPSGMIIREGVAGGASALTMQERVTRVLQRRDWPPRYDVAIHNYFLDDPDSAVSQRR